MAGKADETAARLAVALENTQARHRAGFSHGLPKLYDNPGPGENDHGSRQTSDRVIPKSDIQLHLIAACEAPDFECIVHRWPGKLIHWQQRVKYSSF